MNSKNLESSRPYQNHIWWYRGWLDWISSGNGQTVNIKPSLIKPEQSSSKLNHSLSLHVLTCPVQFSKSLESLGLGSKRHSLWIWQPEHYLEEWTCLIISFFLHNTTLSWWDGGNQRMWAAKYDRNFYYVNIWYKHILIVFGNSAPTCGVFLSKCCFAREPYFFRRSFLILYSSLDNIIFCFFS